MVGLLANWLDADCILGLLVGVPVNSGDFRIDMSLTDFFG